MNIVGAIIKQYKGIFTPSLHTEHCTHKKITDPEQSKFNPLDILCL